MTYGGSIAAIIAAKKARERKEAEQHEEDNLTKYNSDDLEKYEFKIVRSQWGKFKNLETVRNLCAEEAKAGWEMIEKFDDNRIRFKRSKSMRSSDAHQTIDPYRTTIDGSTTSKFLLIFGLSMVFLIAGIIFFASGGYIEVTDPVQFVILGILVFAVIMLIVSKKKSKKNYPY
ncbi:MAG: hypothetical protein DWP97_14420 [Calditrichaeota bacterium]|nr:MAG: hypothetical protein DWP97_14420 [Calditrichota bacterium]